MIIELTPNEATVLHIILERIGGCDKAAGRQHAYSLLKKLEEAGETFSQEKEDFFPVCEERDLIYFKV